MTKLILLKPFNHKKHSKNSKYIVKQPTIVDKVKRTRIVLYLFLFFGITVNAQDFITTWETTTVNEVITLPNSGAAAGYDFTVDWGDRTPIETNVMTPGKQHVFATPGVYTVSISGLFEEFDFTGIPTSPNANNLRSIIQWGNLAVSKLSFNGASRLQIIAADVPNLANVTSFDNLFNGASIINADLSGWNTSTITSMEATFRNATSFNGNISTWDTSEVTNMIDMFSGATSFNSNIGGWNTSKVMDMSTMFFNATLFNQNIGSWVTNEVTNMTGMFNTATSFNQNIGGWNTGKVTNMSLMFRGAINFNSDIGRWDTSMVDTMNNMFAGTDSFNQDIGGWNTSNVNSMSGMFSGSLSFNQNINSWNTGMVNTMSFMFANAAAFNQDVSNWNTSNVLSMFRMFRGATDFNQSLGDWNISNVGSLTEVLSNSGLSTLNYDATLIGWASRPIQTGLTIGANGLTYCLGETARNTLTNAPNLITIVDDGSDCSPLFITTWQSTTTNQIITLPNNGITNEYSFSIDWGDGTPIESNITTPNATHIYATPGTYRVHIDGVFERFNLENVPVNATNLLSVEQWGALSMSKISFMNASNFQINATDVPNLSRVLSFDNIFNGASIVNADLSGWDVSTVTNMTSAFRSALAFNGNITNWNTTNVTNMSFMFDNTQAFNQDISGWNTMNVLDMSSMFGNALVFNRNISSWNTSSANDLSFMFFNTPVFNQNISSWITNGVTNMEHMFDSAASFNQDLSNWNTSMVSNMDFMFNSTPAFDQDLSGFEISSVTSMTDMLSNSSLSTANYDATLIGWESQTVLNNVPLGADGLTYCLAGDQRNDLINNNSWVITGDSLGCSSIFAYSITTTSDAIEGTSDVEFTVSTDGGIINTTGAPITGTIMLTGTATNGTDYTDVMIFSIPSGENSILITVPVINDLLAELTETIIATISAPNTGTINATNTTDSANIIDDDRTGLTISIGSPIDAVEGTSNATLMVTLDNNIVNGTGAPITGIITLSGTATNGTDYTDVTTFSIANGDSNAEIIIPVIDDTEIEFTETIIARISAPSLGTINTTNDIATANIIDDESARLTISIGSPVDGTEGIADATFTVSIDDGAVNGTGTAITGIITFTGTASNGTDYTNVTTFSIAIDDTEIESTETIIAAISAPSIGSINASNDAATANIISDDIAPNPNLALSKTGIYVDANNDGSLNIGDQIQYTFTIENNGTEIIRNINISDPLPGINLTGGLIDLTPGQADNTTFTATYVLTKNDILNGSVVNQALATGIDPMDMPIMDFSDDPNDDSNVDDDNDGDAEDPTITELLGEDELIIYEVITPNGDGFNDELRISGLARFPNNNIIIYNRWGAKVFEANGYEQENVPRFAGVAKGKSKVLPSGAYFYTLQFQNEIGVLKSKSGFLHIN